MPNIPADELNALAERLRGWQPAAGGLDHDRLIFEAGRAAGLAEARAGYRRRIWPMAMAMAASLFLAIGLLLTRGDERGGRPERIELSNKTVEVRRLPRPVAESVLNTPIDPNSYLALSRRIADGSLDSTRRDPTRAVGSDRPGRIESPSPLRARDLDHLLNL